MADNKKNTRGASANVVQMDKAAREIERQRKFRADPPPLTPRGLNKVLAGQWTRGLDGMPTDQGCECPVEPIGFEGGNFYFIDSRGQFRSMTADKVNQSGIQDLFAVAPNYPKWMHPRWGKAKSGVDPETGEPYKPPIASFQADEIKETLFKACAYRGFFSPADKMRGRGGWTMAGGQFVYHAGDRLWMADKGGRFKELPTGVHQGKLYPRLSALPEPWTEKITPEDNPARVLLETFRKWTWTRPEIDPLLLLGWIGNAFLGGALDWRSAVLLLGDRSTGKSTLQKALHAIFGEALFKSADTTAAGIYQAMGHDARPVALDELEPDSDPRKLQNVVHLMRTSASGDVGNRGGPTKGEASQFQMYSAFLFSAINNPLHGAQDMSRCAVLRLGPINLNQPKPAALNAETTGPMVLALMMHGWGEGGLGFKQQFDRFAEALQKGGHDKRGQDTYGTLLACAAILLGDDLAAAMDTHLDPNEERWWTENFTADSLPEVEDAKPNYRQCVDRILTAPVRAWRNSSRNTIGQAIADSRTTDDDGHAREPDYTYVQARRDITIAGFGLFNTREIVAPVMRKNSIKLAEALQQFGLEDSKLVLAVPNQSVKVAEHLEGSDWQHGAWKDALRQCPVPGVMITNSEITRLTIDGTQTRCTLIVLDRYHEAPEK
ncbi:Uncharacterised protein [Afipia felis]|uniref:Superfamily II helicase and inactivated derivatives n=2 Tax=Afipia felis TaxID=1035 RepID=A0A380W6K4_AFIFE|nr:hypothetical protein HMPREF9697_04002 [Afipia felis ATCC 53690]SUU76152.1 Uncharacterised protein [Afipia felis]SUU84219.1 Uncharacterised protein [Afipia felis]